MSDIRAESFSYYGGSVTRMSEGFWTTTDHIVSLSVPSFELSPDKFWAEYSTNGLALAGARLPLISPIDEIIYSQLVYIPSFTNITQPRMMALLNAGATRILSFVVLDTGQLQLRGNGDTTLATSAGQVIFPGTAHHIEVYALRHASAGEVVVRVDGKEVINADTLALGNDDFAIYSWAQSGTGTVDQRIFFTSIWIREVTGESDARNEDFENGAEVATLFPISDTDEAGWTFRARKNLGTGILDLRAQNNSAVSAADASSLEIGASDFELTAFVRFVALPSGSNKAQIVGKWQESGNARSWQLYKGGPSLDGGALCFRTSTDGTAGTVNNVFQWPWEPDLDVWYAIRVCRDSGVVHLFIAELDDITGDWEFVEMGSGGFASPETYANTGATLAIGAEMSSGSGVVSNSRLNGFMDEVRLTIGEARETSSFSLPNQPLPRGAGNDPEWSSVAVLCGFDSGVNDESSFARTMTARNGAVIYTPDDGEYAFQSIWNADPRDDTFIEAALVPAFGVFSLNGLPTDGDEVVVGTVTYTFVDALDSVDGPANAVVIGGDEEECLTNLAAAINEDSGEGSVYGDGTDANPDAAAVVLPGNQMRAVARVPGSAGNSLATTTTAANGSWSDTTMDGGQDIPGPSEFTLPRLPIDATRVFSVHIIAREYKTSSGPCSTQFSFVDGQGAAAAGAEQALTDNATYRVKGIFIDDPTTGGPISPVTMTNARVRTNRTV